MRVKHGLKVEERTYTYDEIFRGVLDYFNGDETAAREWIVKYIDAGRPDVIEVRPTELECDVVRFQNKKEKWVAFVGLKNERPYEIFTGLMDDEEGIVLPKSVTHGKIIKTKNADGTNRYDFQFQNKRGYKITVEGLSGKFNKEYWNYAKLISGILRYHMPLQNVLHLIDSLSLDAENINTWKTGVVRALKKYVSGSENTETDEPDVDEDNY